MSLSNEPVFSELKNHFICGYKDIENKHYAGASGKHLPGGQAVDTTNGAGPHNIQIFVLAADGTVLTCLPGYWNPDDLASELVFATHLNDVWTDNSLSRSDKDQLFAKAQIEHIKEHSPAERKRSQLQHFDVVYEKQHRGARSDIFYEHSINPRTGNIDDRSIKTADVIMHQRMASRPFESYKDFDVVAFSDYGKPMYDKQEDMRNLDGQIASGRREQDFIGNDPRAHPIKTEVKRQGKSILRQGLTSLVRQSVQSIGR